MEDIVTRAEINYRCILSGGREIIFHIAPASIGPQDGWRYKTEGVVQGLKAHMFNIPVSIYYNCNSTQLSKFFYLILIIVVANSSDN
jgi:hypothetical protein